MHGCLAAVEILRDTTLETPQMDLLEMIESCANTLLYTMNHLLDFSNINDLDRTQSRNRRSSQGETSTNLSRNVFGRTVEDYLCRLVQEVVDGVSYGHAREQASHELELHIRVGAIGAAGAGRNEKRAGGKAPAGCLDQLSFADGGLIHSGSRQTTCGLHTVWPHACGRLCRGIGHHPG